MAGALISEKEIDQVVNRFGDMNVSCHGTSDMDESVILEGRPYEGCLIMWKSAINTVIRPLVCVSRCICGIQMCLKGENITIGGAFNIAFNKNGKCKELLCDFISIEILSLVEDTDGTNPYSFKSKTNKFQSLIDHFVISDALCSKLVKYNILHDGHNMSDHSSIMIEIDTPIVNFKTTLDSTNCNQSISINVKENLSNYSQVLDCLLKLFFLVE